MGLRLLLVGMVASLGIDLPSRHDLRDWTGAGRTWLCVQLDEWNAWDGLSEDAAAPRTVQIAPEPGLPSEIITDSEFTAVLDEMLADFSADSDAVKAEPIVAADATPADPATEADATAPVDAAEPSLETPVATTELEPTIAPVAFEPIEVGDDLYPGLAFELNFASDGIVTVEQPETVDPEDFEAEALAAGLTPAPVAESGPEIEAAPAPMEPAPAAEAATIADATDAVPNDSASAATGETAEIVAPATVGRSRNQRLATAFRLTGEAFLAWSRLLDSPAVVSIRP